MLCRFYTGHVTLTTQKSTIQQSVEAKTYKYGSLIRKKLNLPLVQWVNVSQV